MFAIIQTGAKQYKVAKGDVIDIEKLEGKDGAKIETENVLLVNDGTDTTVGAPLVSGAKVTMKVVEQTKGDKIRVFKMKPKKRYQKTQGHRQQITRVEILDITVGATKKAAPKKEEKEA